jgi:hypothetical protein
LYVLATIGATYNCIIFDISTNSFLPITIALPTSTSTSAYNSVNNTLYVGGFLSDNVYVISCSTNSLVSTINLLGKLPSVLTFNANDNLMYVGSPAPTVNVSVINCSTNTLSTEITNPNTTYSIAFNGNTNNLYLGNGGSNDISQLTTSGITTSPYYISGSVNYNLFVNNLNNEPVYIQMIRLLAENQNQLYNQVQLTKIDSNGNQIFLPDFPINQVSTFQEQGKISEITLKDVIFDGRTYVNQYQINANETISIEIYYKQVDLTSASASFPIFFKPKIQLKEYIKNN